MPEPLLNNYNINTIIFDLSEVLIAGLVGAEMNLAVRLNREEDTILPALALNLQELCRGEITEEDYLTAVIEKNKWNIKPDELKAIIRGNFHIKVEGMEELLAYLNGKYKLILLSDHAREWVEYILSVHPFLNLFDLRFFSFALRQTKKEPSTFTMVLKQINRAPEECLFIDDNPANVQNALTAGIRGIVFTSAVELKDELNRLGK